MTEFEKKIREALHRYLVQQQEADLHLPECPDVEAAWASVGEDYIADGLREFAAYPTVSLGWMMFVGMAMACLWDSCWDEYGSKEHVYLALRDVRGFDHTDDYILDEILHLDADAHTATSHLVNECAQHSLSLLWHEGFAPGSAEAFRCYVACLHQLYLMGMAVQLHRLGYHMERMG